MKYKFISRRRYFLETAIALIGSILIGFAGFYINLWFGIFGLTLSILLVGAIVSKCYMGINNKIGDNHREQSAGN